MTTDAEQLAEDLAQLVASIKQAQHQAATLAESRFVIRIQHRLTNTTLYDGPTTESAAHSFARRVEDHVPDVDAYVEQLHSMNAIQIQHWMQEHAR